MSGNGAQSPWPTMQFAEILTPNRRPYTLAVDEAQPLEVFTINQVAEQLTSGFWGGFERSFDIGADGIITVDISAIGSAESFLAVEALNLWSDVLGITFQQVVGGRKSRSRIPKKEPIRRARSADRPSFPRSSMSRAVG